MTLKDMGRSTYLSPTHTQELSDSQGLNDCNGCRTPMQPNVELEPVEKRQTIHEVGLSMRKLVNDTTANDLDHKVMIMNDNRPAEYSLDHGGEF